MKNLKESEEKPKNKGSLEGKKTQVHVIEFYIY